MPLLDDDEALSFLIMASQSIASVDDSHTSTLFTQTAKNSSCHLHCFQLFFFSAIPLDLLETQV
jgi:hypothetical protein